MSLPFTKEVVRSLDYLRQAVREVGEGDAELAETMTAIVDDLIINLENQMMLVFANCNIKERERDAMLTKAGPSDVPILKYYQNARAEAPGAAGGAGPGRAEGKATPKALDLSLGKGVPPEVEALRAVSTSLYLVVEALAHNLKAERAKLLLGHRGTGSLRVVTSVPDCTAAQRSHFIPMHQGLQGASFCCEVGIRVDAIDAEMRRNYVAPTDEALRQETTSSICFPVMDPLKGCAIGVIECSNKARGAPWSASDEALMHHAAVLVAYFLMTYDVDLNAGYTFNPAALHVLRPYRPGPFNEGLESLPAAMDFVPKQLVARVRDASAMPLAVKGKNQAALEAVDEVNRVIDVKEMRTYVRMVDESHLRAMSALVQSREREEQLQEELEKAAHRMRVLEENARYLQEQLQDAKRAITMHTFGQSSDPNYSDFAATVGASDANSPALSASANPKPASSSQLKALDTAGIGAAASSSAHAHAQQRAPLPPIRGAKLRDFMLAASTTLQQLRTTALANSDAAQRARLFSTPQPQKLPTSALGVLSAAASSVGHPSNR